MTGHHPTRQPPQPPHRHGHQPPRATQQNSLCQICQIPHKHFSSLRLREMLGVEGTEKFYFCPSCKSSHRSYTRDRVKLVVSDSSLHQFFAPPGDTRAQYKGDTLHADYITIPGGCIDELYNAFRLDLEFSPPGKPMDIVLVMGYADLLKGHSRNFIMECLQLFSNTVLELGKDQHPDTPNTISVATLMYPPRLAWFYDNGPEPQNYLNEIEKIDWLNAKIRELNLANSSPFYPRFHTYGVRKATRYHYDRYGYKHQYAVKSHRWEHWLESAKTDKLHLREDRRIKMGSAVNEYFIQRTTNTKE